MKDMKELNRKDSGKTFGKSSLGLTVLVLAALGLSGCIVADGPGYRGDRHGHHWNNNGWNNGPGNSQGWQGNDGSWKHHH